MCRCRPCALGHRDRREKRGRRENGLECGAIGTCETLVGGGRDQDLRVRRRVGCCRRGCWRRRGSGFRSLRRRRKKQRCEERGRGREEGRRTSEIQWTGILLSTFLNLRNFVRKFCPISPRAFHPNLALFGTPSFILTLPRPLSSARSPSPSRSFLISRLPVPPSHIAASLHFTLPLTPSPSSIILSPNPGGYPGTRHRVAPSLCRSGQPLAAQAVHPRRFSSKHHFYISLGPPASALRRSQTPLQNTPFSISCIPETGTYSPSQWCNDHSKRRLSTPKASLEKCHRFSHSMYPSTSQHAFPN
jgi:hypothetical protein